LHSPRVEVTGQLVVRHIVSRLALPAPLQQSLHRAGVLETVVPQGAASRDICDMDYVHVPELAPTQDILDEYRKNKGDWGVYEQKFLELMRNREIETKLNPALISDSCLLCSEDKPDHCHRRLVAEYLESHWGDVEVSHIV